MDKNSNNYKLIESIITAHPKYVGCESVLEEIVSDVLSRTETVLNTTSNSEVLISYIDKIVSSSIVRITKKNNLKTRSSRTIEINLERPIVSTTIRPIPKIEEDDNSNIMEVQEEFFEEESVVEEFDAITVESESIEDVEISLNDTSLEDISIVQENSEFGIYEEDLAKEHSLEIIAEKEEVFAEEINESFFENQESELNFESQDTFEIASALLDKIQEDNVVNQEFENIDSVDENVALDLSNIDEITIDLEQSDDFSVNYEESPEEFSLLDTENVLNDTVEINTIENTVIEEENLLFDENSLSLDTSIDLQEDFDDNFVTEEVVETTIEPVFQNNDSKKVGINIKSFYNKFAYASNGLELNFDYEAKQECIFALDKKYPEWKILDICELKFNQKMSMSEIAKILNKTDKDILEYLNEIVYAVKD